MAKDEEVLEFNNINTNTQEINNVDCVSVTVGEQTCSDTSLNGLKDGKRAWLVCVSAFILQITILGILHSFGVFFVAFLEDFQCSKASAAWIGSACYGLTMTIAPFASLVIKKFGHRISAACGCLICASSMITSSFMIDEKYLYGSFTLLFALGCSLAYTPCMTITTDYFHKYASQATGIIVAGSSTGTLIYSPLAQALVSAFGWRVAFRCLAGGCFVGFLCALQFKPLQSPDKKSESQRIKESLARPDINELQLWKNKVYMIWIFSIFCVMFGYYIPYVHLISHAVEIGVSAELGSVLIMVLGGTCAFGRVIWGKILQKHVLNRLQMDQLSMVITGTFVMILPLLKSFAGLLIYVIIIGLLDGCYVVLLPTMTEAFAGSEKKVIGWGFLNLVCSVSFTMGPVVAGWIYDATGSYDISFHVAGVPIVLGAVILFFIPWAQKTAKTTNVMTAARQSYPGIMCKEALDNNDKYIEITTAITIPKSRTASHEVSFDDANAVDGRDSIVIVDLSTSRVQAFSTSQGGGRSVLMNPEALPDTIVKAICVLQKKSQSMSVQGSYNGPGSHSYSMSKTSEGIPISSPTALVRSSTTSPTDITSPVGSPPQDSENLSSAFQRFQQITSTSCLPPIAELPINGVRNVPINTDNNMDTSASTSNHTCPGSPTENHAMFEQMADLGDLSHSNVELNNRNVNGDR